MDEKLFKENNTMNNELFATCAQRYIDTVFRVALNYIGSHADAEDVTQNVFLKLLRETKPFESQDHIRNWLIRVTINECKNLVRSRWWKQESLDNCSKEISFETREQTELYHAVMELPKRYRLPIYLHYYEGYSTQEIGELLRLPKNTVCTQLSRGRELLKKTLTEVDDNV